MKIPRAIIYPLKKGGSRFQDFELRHSLRSLEKHWRGNEPIFLLSSYRPAWLSEEVHHVPARGYMEALKKAADLAEEIIWWNDDIYLLSETLWEDFYRWRRSSNPVSKKKEAVWLEAPNKWRRKLGKVIARCRAMGLETYKYSSHSPYLYETEKLKEVIGKFDLGYKTAIETAYGNYWKVPTKRGGDKLMRYSDKRIPLDLSNFRMFNHDDKSFGPHIRGFLSGLFPNPSRFEIR